MTNHEQPAIIIIIIDTFRSMLLFGSRDGSAAN
jgi:hypothetical protein